MHNFLNLLIYNKDGTLFYEQCWTKNNSTNQIDPSLVYGLVIAVNNFFSKLSNNENDFFKSIETDHYILHSRRFTTGWIIVLISNIFIRDASKLLNMIYHEFISKCILKIPPSSNTNEKLEKSQIEPLIDQIIVKFEAL